MTNKEIKDLVENEAFNIAHASAFDGFNQYYAEEKAELLAEKVIEAITEEHPKKGHDNPTKKVFGETLIMNLNFMIKNTEKIEYPKCKTCIHLNNENNFCSVIDQFNDVEFGCINHCL